MWGAPAQHGRQAIVVCLAERPRAVGELADELPISGPADSQHLKVLKDRGLVGDAASGTHRGYPLNSAGWRRCVISLTRSGTERLPAIRTPSDNRQ